MNASSKPAIGRPRSEKTRQAILRATFQLLKDKGFESVSTHEIAKKARVSSATLYRWWNNKQEILLEAYLERSRELLPYGKRGSPLLRLRRYTIRLAEFLNSDNGRVFLRLMLAIQDNPALQEGFYQSVFLPRREEACRLVEQAVEAGELPRTVDPNLLINTLIGAQIPSALMGRPEGKKFAERLFDFATKAARVESR